LPGELGLIDFAKDLAQPEQLVGRKVFTPPILDGRKVEVIQDSFNRCTTTIVLPFKAANVFVQDAFM
jgi:hypothetical protein